MIENNLFDNIFCIPYNDRYIIYLPLQGIILEGNDKFVNLLHRAKEGDKSALSQLDLEQYLEEEARRAKIQSEEKKTRIKNTSFKPTMVSLFLTTACTLRCGYCYANGGAQDIQMPWNMATNILDEIARNAQSSPGKKMTVHFHGGGDVGAAWSLLIKIRKYLRELEQKHCLSSRTSIGINGVLGREQQQWIVENIDSATISMDGPPEIQDAQRPLNDGGASCSYVYETIRAFDNANFPYALRTTVTKQSVKRLEEIVTFFCRNFNVREIKAEPMFPSGRALVSEFDAPEPLDFVENFRKGSKVAEKFGRILSYSGARLGVLTDVFCQAAGNSFAITPEGWVTSCYEVLYKNDPLSDVFFYGRYNSESGKLEIDDTCRNRLKELSVWHKPFCAKCFCKWHCAGDCPAKSIQSRNGDDTVMPDRCYINRELTKDQIVKTLENYVRAHPC